MAQERSTRTAPTRLRGGAVPITCPKPCEERPLHNRFCGRGVLVPICDDALRSHQCVPRQGVRSFRYLAHRCARICAAISKQASSLDGVLVLRDIDCRAGNLAVLLIFLSHIQVQHLPKGVRNVIRRVCLTPMELYQHQLYQHQLHQHQLHQHQLHQHQLHTASTAPAPTVPAGWLLNKVVRGSW
jgi:hypothetical protein